MNKALKQNKIFLSKTMKMAIKYGLYLCDFLDLKKTISIELMKKRHERRFGSYIQPNEIKKIGGAKFVAHRSSKGKLLYYSQIKA